MVDFSDVLLTVDFDHTMTGTDARIPERNLEAVRWFMERGGTFTLNTGRSLTTMRAFLDEVPHNAPLLLYNGSVAYENGKIVDCTPIDLDMWDTVCTVAEAFPELNLELPGQFQVLSYGQDGSLQSSAGRWESQIQLPADGSSRIDIFMQPGAAVQASGGPAPSFSAQYGMQLQTTADRPMPMVTALELGDLQEPDPARPALILCRPGDESLWDMAKRCGSRVCDIRQSNGLEGEPDQNRILLIPVNR